MVFIAYRGGYYCVEKNKNTINYKKQPRFYGELMGGLLVAYSSSSEASRYIIASDILGYVKASLIYTKKIDNKFDDEQNYKELMDSLFETLQSAISYFKAGESAASNQSLNTVVDTLKIIIMTENLVAENWEHTANPLGTANVENDRIANAIYRDIDNVQ